MLSSKTGNCWLDLLSWKKTTVVPFFFFFCILFSWVAFWQPTRRAELIITKSMNLRVWSLKITRRELENMNTCYKSGPGREHMNTSHFLDKETFFNCWHTDRQLHHRNEAIFSQSHDSLLGSNSEVIFLTGRVSWTQVRQLDRCRHKRLQTTVRNQRYNRSCNIILLGNVRWALKATRWCRRLRIVESRCQWRCNVYKLKHKTSGKTQKPEIRAGDTQRNNPQLKLMSGSAFPSV